MTRRPFLRIRSAAGIVSLSLWEANAAFAVLPLLAGALIVLALAVAP